MRKTLKRAGVHFAYAFIATLVSGLTGLALFPDLQTAKAFGASVVVGALVAGFRAAEGVLSKHTDA